MKRLTLLAALAALLGCGVDGEPRAPEPGVSISGQVKVGVSGSM